MDQDRRTLNFPESHYSLNFFDLVNFTVIPIQDPMKRSQFKFTLIDSEQILGIFIKNENSIPGQNIPKECISRHFIHISICPVTTLMFKFQRIIQSGEVLQLKIISHKIWKKYKIREQIPGREKRGKKTSSNK